MECVFLNGSSCRALKIAKCSDTCKFRLTKEEFTEGQAKAKAILQKRGLKRVEIKTTEGVIVSTVKEEKMLDSYRQGYLKALMDVKDYFDYHSESLKHNRMFNSKKIPLLCQAFIDYRETMMTYGGSDLELTLTKGGEIVESTCN